MQTVPYVYKIEVVRVIDGDTIDADVDVGFYLRSRQRLRLLRINAPEMKGDTRDAGIAAKAHLMHLLDAPELFARTEKSDAFGRFLAEITARSADGHEWNVNAAMLEDGFAVEFPDGK